MSALLELGLHPAPDFDLLDLRHFSAAQLAPLLRDECNAWEQRFRWDYTDSVRALNEYIDSRALTGTVAIDSARRVLGYTFSVYEAEKAVLGDVWALNRDQPSGVAHAGPHFTTVCEALLDSMLRTLKASPGVRRIESQLLMFPPETLRAVFASHGFRAHRRLFLIADTAMAAAVPMGRPLPHIAFERWSPHSVAESARVIYTSYLGHADAGINDQYQSIAGAERFLHSIIRFPGCGRFSAEHSVLARDRRTGQAVGVLLCSELRADTAHITQLCVVPEARASGLGSQLLSVCTRQLAPAGITAVSLTVTENNTTARRLYDRFGFGNAQSFDAMTWDEA